MTSQSVDSHRAQQGALSSMISFRPCVSSLRMPNLIGIRRREYRTLREHPSGRCDAFRRTDDVWKR